MNNHYISQCLTKPWEGGDRKLRFYDFDTDSFHEKTSRKLFADEGLHSVAFEQWMSRIVEDPLARARDRIQNNDFSVLGDLKTFTAVAFMLFMQGGRVVGLNDAVSREELEKCLAFDSIQIESMVQYINTNYALALVGVEIEANGSFAPMCFPSTGIFQGVAPCDGGDAPFCAVFALPLTADLAVTAVRKDQRADLSRVHEYIARDSVGGPNARRVVIPPAAFFQYSETDIRMMVRECRERNAYLLGKAAALKVALGELRDLTVAAVEPASATPHRGRT